MIVPGSEQVKRAAESKGLHEIFQVAGAEWLAPGALCVWASTETCLRAVSAQPRHQTEISRVGKDKGVALTSSARLWPRASDHGPVREHQHLRGGTVMEPLIRLARSAHRFVSRTSIRINYFLRDSSKNRGRLVTRSISSTISDAPMQGTSTQTSHSINPNLKPLRFCSRAQILAQGAQEKEPFMHFMISGFRAVFAPSFGEIFAANCLKNGVLTARLDQETIQIDSGSLDQAQEPRVSVDIDQECITLPAGQVVSIQPRSISKALPHEWL